MTEYNCSERLAIVLKFSYNYDNFNIKKENNMSVNESQIKNTTASAIDDDDAVIFKERKKQHDCSENGSTTNFLHDHLLLVDLYRCQFFCRADYSGY